MTAPLFPELKAKHEALRAAGKPPRLVITAVMRKLLILVNALRNGRTWTPGLARPTRML